MDTGKEYKSSSIDQASMQASLDTKQNLEERFWIDSNLNKFDELLRIHHSKPIEVFTQIMLDHIAQTTNAFSGVLYVLSNEQESGLTYDNYVAMAGYFIKIDMLKHNIVNNQEGIVGQAIATQKILRFDNIPAKHVKANLTSNQNLSIRILPLTFNNQVYGVLEITYIAPLITKYDELLERMVKSLAAIVETIINNALNARLLKEFQAQTKRLLAQETELMQHLDDITSAQQMLSEDKRKLIEKEEELNKLMNEIKINKADMYSSKDKMEEYLLVYQEQVKILKQELKNLKE